MKIDVRVKTKSKVEGIEKITENSYVVRVHVPPVEGQANLRIIEILAQYFNRSKSEVILLKGVKSKNKVFEIT